jgi:hypothetical protein
MIPDYVIPSPIQRHNPFLLQELICLFHHFG